MRTIAALFLLLPMLARADCRAFPVVEEMRSDRFTMTLDGQPAAVVHTATTYHFVNFEFRGPTSVSITSPTDGYWSAGVEVQPWRWGIRPAINGWTITFTLNEPGKFSITRPGDHGGTAEMLFLFANPRRPMPRYPTRRTCATSGPAHTAIASMPTQATAVNSRPVPSYSVPSTFRAQIASASGSGEPSSTMIPKNPASDEGWMHKPNWHGIVMDHAADIHISGITVVVRSRTWMIQLLSSHDLLFET